MAEYIYFCSSLPFLYYGAEPLISSKSFLQSAATTLSVADYQKLCGLNFSKASERIAESVFFQEYYCWEVALRNQVMSERLKMVEQGGSLAKPHSGGMGSVMLAAAVEQVLQKDPYAIEKCLDQLRWAKLNELCGSRLFDMMFLACYLLKLKLLERAALWQKELGKELYEKASKEIVEDKKVGEV